VLRKYNDEGWKEEEMDQPLLTGHDQGMKYVGGSALRNSG
jgi:hypothetical protein